MNKKMKKKKELTALLASIFIGISLLSGATFAQEINIASDVEQNTEESLDTNSALPEGQDSGEELDLTTEDPKETDKTSTFNETTEESEESSNETEEVSATGEMAYVVSYSMHVQTNGWLDAVTNGASAGAAGSGKRAEAVMISILAQEEVSSEAEDTTGEEEADEPASEDFSMGITYRAHVQSIGWQSWVNDGAIAGTTGQAKRMEGIEIKLTGAQAQDYDVYYRVYVNTYGWLSWAKNGEAAGSVGYGKAIESLEIRLYKKDSEDKPAPGESSCLTKSMLGSLGYKAHVQSIGWQSVVKANGIAGTTGKSKRMEALVIERDQGDNLFSGEISYRAHVQSIGWQDWVNDGAIAGTTGASKRMEAIQIKLTGDLATYADVYYRTHIQGYGWLGWAKNGQVAGSTGIAYQMEAIQIVLTPKDMEAPGSNSGYFKDSTILESRVANMRVAKSANQLILVSASGSRATVSMYQKNSHGTWKNLLSSSGYVGKSGVGKAHEGLSITPEGAYHIMNAFGIKSNPGCSIGYTKVDSTHYYVGDPNSPYYNKLVSTRTVTNFRRSYGEQLIKYPPAYNYILDFDYNPNGTPHAGSCFFLHCSTGKATAGCITVPEATMVKILKSLQGNCMIVISNGDKVYKY